MDLKPGMSMAQCKKAEEMEKGALKDAAIGLSLAATLASAGMAHSEHMKPMSLNQMKSQQREPAAEDPHFEQLTTEMPKETEAKITKWRDKLNAVRQRQGKSVQHE